MTRYHELRAELKGLRVVPTRVEDIAVANTANQILSLFIDRLSDEDLTALLLHTLLSSSSTISTPWP